MTSFDVVAYLKGILKTKKIGHTGTLDPGAVGVLPVCVGAATKAIEFITDKDKSYRAELTLGISTDTKDSSGEVVSSCEVAVSEAEIIAAMKSFIGRYRQLPPMYSAVKVGGRRLYELARSGITVERQPREVEVYSIDIIDISRPRVIFDVACSKGTYIRTLCADIGERLGCGGHMSFLIRTGAGVFNLDEAVTLEEVEDLALRGRLGDVLINVDEAFKDFDKVLLDNLREKRLLNGAFIELEGGNFKPGQIVRVYSNRNGFVALGEVIVKQGNLFLKSKKLFDGGSNDGSYLR
mgnify:FL=1